MNKYELVILLKNKEEIKALKNFFNQNKIVIKKEEEWGEKFLAYKIKSFKKAYYYLINFLTDKENILKLKQWLNYNENIIRYLLLVKEK